MGDISIRAAKASDQPLLRKFACSNGPPYEREVEDYLRGPALNAALAKMARHELYLAFEGDQLIAAFCWTMTAIRGAGSPGNRLVNHLAAFAIVRSHQGAHLKDKTRLSDFLMQRALDQTPTGPGVVIAYIDKGNGKSQELCKRNYIDRFQDNPDNPNEILAHGKFAN